MSSRRSWGTVILAATLGVTAAMFAAQAAAAEVALAQRGPATATGVLVSPVEDNTPDPTSEYRLTAEATGVTYVLVEAVRRALRDAAAR